MNKEECFKILDKWEKYAGFYDGETFFPTKECIDKARKMIKSFSNQPDFCSANGEGGIVFEWRYESFFELLEIDEFAKENFRTISKSVEQN